MINEILLNFETKAIKIQPANPKIKNEKETKEIKKPKKEKRSILVINDKTDDNVKRAGQNLKGAKFINLDNINIIDLLKYKYLILTKDSISELEKRYSVNN